MKFLFVHIVHMNGGYSHWRGGEQLTSGRGGGANTPSTPVPQKETLLILDFKVWGDFILILLCCLHKISIVHPSQDMAVAKFNINTFKLE